MNEDGEAQVVSGGRSRSLGPGRVSRRHQLIGRLRAIGVVAALACSLATAVALVGWIGGWKLLASWHPLGVVIDPDSAVSLIIAGALLGYLRSDRRSHRAWLVYLGSGVILVTGILGLFQSFGIGAGLEHWPFSNQASRFGPTDGGSTNAAGALILAGLALLARVVFPRAENALALSLVMFSLWGLVGVLYRIDPADDPMAIRTPMSMPGAVACLSLAVGMLLLPAGRGLTSLVAREGQGGRLARRMLPLAFVSPAVITAMLWIGVVMRRYPPEFVAVLLAISSGVVFFGLVWWYADTLDRAEARSRRSDAALRSSEAFYHSLVESLPQSILRKDRHGRFTFGNGKVLDALGIQLDQLVNRSDFDFYPSELAEKYRRDDLQVLESGEILDMVEAHIEPGGELRYVQVLKTPLPDHEGRTVGVQCIFWDVTERKIAEEKLQTQNALLAEMARSEKAAHDARKQAQAQMIQSAKLAGLGELVAGVAHEINNPLAFVNNNVAVLERDVGELRRLIEMYAQGTDLLLEHRPELAESIRHFREETEIDYTLTNMDSLLARTRDGLRRIQQIVKDLRVFARLDESDLAEFDLNDNVRTTVTIIMGHAKRKRVVIDMDLHPLPLITGYVARINQVVMNLISNAIDACHEGGKVMVHTQPDDDTFAVRLDVVDNGSGIDPAILPRIFDPFFTTKPVGVGTGLGLSISYGILQDHGGLIEADSRPGEGARFTIRLPLKCRDRATIAASETDHQPESSTFSTPN